MLCEQCQTEISKGMKTCFVVSPIGEPDSETRTNADKLLEDIIRPVCVSFGIEPMRVDSAFSRHSITDTIMDLLESSDLIIADITGNNPNVFFEIGYCMALGSPLVLITSSYAEIPFDIKVMPIILYDMSTVTKRKESIEAIKRRVEGYLSGEIKSNRVLRESDIASEREILSMFEIVDD